MCALDKKSISIGQEDFKTIIDKNGYLVDKTLMIRDLLDSTSTVTLFTRPRRFGKTLNMSMIRRFFEDERAADGTPIDNRYLFDGLAISQCGEACLRHQQQYPVISLSLKSAKQPNFDMAYKSLLDEIAGEFRRHKYVMDSNLLEDELKIMYEEIQTMKAEAAAYAKSLGFLSKCLEKYHGKKCIILIDEYDVPLESAWFAGFYEEMIDFIRSLFESSLKTNNALEFGVITGCLRISKESIFTGLNNLRINSVLGFGYGDSFGFTPKEVMAMLDYYGMGHLYDEVRQWYDGYQFDQAEIYNPWSILNYVEDHRVSSGAMARTHWINTSSNSIVRELIENADQKVRDEVERLIAGEALEKPIHEEITYADMHETEDNLWNFLYFTGYLTSRGQSAKDEKTYIKMVIPNTEIRTIYRDTVLRWFDKKLKLRDLRPLAKAIEEGDCDTIGNMISDELMDTISFFDYGESYYHGFLAGLLRAAGGYTITSNRENGLGRTDLIMKTPRIRNGRAMILELKMADSFDQMETACQEALSQIEERKYEENLKREGYRQISKYGLSFFKKECMAVKA